MNQPINKATSENIDMKALKKVAITRYLGSLKK
jgi:hypothetical protein